MKKNLLIRNLSIFFLGIAVLFSCTKDIEDVRLDPTLETAEVLELTSNSAKVIGFVVASGSGFTERGVVYNTQPNPTIDNMKVVYQGESPEATFSVTLSGLTHVTKYYVRAYGENDGGVIYGKEFEFTTLPILPTVSTKEVTGVTGTTAETGGEVTDDGGSPITEKGVVYATSPNPTIADGKVVSGDGVGEFDSQITGLEGLTTYYVKAFATNSVGTVYGEEMEFTTLVSIRTWYIAGGYVAASYPDYVYTNWDPATSPIIRSSADDTENLEGYIYMALANNEFKVVTQPSWDGDYGDGGPGQLAVGGGNINLPGPHHYKLNVNPTTLTYTVQPLVWGVIGTGTPGGWGSETPLTYKPAQRVWSGGLTLTGSPEIKFRAHDWPWNYGGTDGELWHDGPNIELNVAGDYFFILDLSTPHEYTYSANRWGLIGSAAGGWGDGDDIFMLWNQADQAMVVTADLAVGEFKFRANGGWDVNLGGTPDDLTFGGGNISVSEAGNYTIKLYPRPDGGTYTIVKN
jgi:hypothetical protein